MSHFVPISPKNNHRQNQEHDTEDNQQPRFRHEKSHKAGDNSKWHRNRQQAQSEAEVNLLSEPVAQYAARIPEKFDLDNGGCAVADGDAGVYYRAETGNHLLVGTLDPACDEKEYVDPDDYNPGFTEQWTRQVWRVAQRFPELGIANTAQGVVGLYDVTEDWIPIYDKSSLPGYYMAIGTSGNQFKNAPMVGALMAELITACQTGHDHDADPVQFHLPHLDRSIDLGFFSRKRAPNAESSFTVMA